MSLENPVKIKIVLTMEETPEGVKCVLKNESANRPDNMLDKYIMIKFQEVLDSIPEEGDE